MTDVVQPLSVDDSNDDTVDESNDSTVESQGSVEDRLSAVEEAIAVLAPVIEYHRHR